MTLTRQEIEDRWLGGSFVGADMAAIVESFERVERLLGREWLEKPLEDGSRGPLLVLPMCAVGDQLATLERAHNRDALIERLRRRDAAALCELHALALCVDAADPEVEVEVEPRIVVKGGDRIPDFRVRRVGDEWTYVEVTAARESDTANAASSACDELGRSFDLVPDGSLVQVRFRDEPTEADISRVRQILRTASVPGVVTDQPRFIIHAEPYTQDGMGATVIAPIGDDESGRPIRGSLRCIVRGDGPKVVGGSALAVRVPYTDERGQKIIDAEARQLPSEGPGLICVSTMHGAYWRALIERSFSPIIRRRISGVLLFHAGLTARGLETCGRLTANPHARTELAGWLTARLETLPPRFTTAGCRIS